MKKIAICSNKYVCSWCCAAFTLSKSMHFPKKWTFSGFCPSSHPNPYYNGEYCCKNDKEKVFKPQGSKCDGSRIQYDSLCCYKNQYIKILECKYKMNGSKSLMITKYKYWKPT